MWEQDESWDGWFAKRRLIDGTTAGRGEILMRRKVHGEWQYRRPTEAELNELHARWAI